MAICAKNDSHPKKMDWQNMHHEKFTPQQLKTLDRFVTNTSENIFALKNLPEVIKGALFSRYSRSSLGLRALLLKEFILSEDTEFASIAGDSTDLDASEQMIAVQKAQSFYDRILDGYGDDSIGELGGAHLAIESVSMLAAKAIEDCRIGGSPLEKSTRYIYFDQKVNGEYLFYKEPILMTSAYRDLYLKTCTDLFEVYGKLIPPLTDLIGKGFPKDPEISQGAYNAALRAKVLDCLRGILPAATLTDMGMFGNGRFFETLIQKLNCDNLAEMKDLGKKSYQELSKVIPSFVRRAEASHRHHQTFAKYSDDLKIEIRKIASKHALLIPKQNKPGVKLVNYDKDSPKTVASGILFSEIKSDLNSIQSYCNSISKEDIDQILQSSCGRRENRRHKSPRALEQASFTFEIVADFGVYRDLHRHRMLTQERQTLTCDLEYYIPEEILGTEMEAPYREAMDRAKTAYDTIAKELPEEAQYIVPMAYNIRFYFHINLRALQWLCELRSMAAGHPSYRLIAQEMAYQVSQAIPEFKRFFKFVDYEGHTLGRLDAEVRQEKKQAANIQG